MVADRIAALVRLRALPRGERRIAMLMPDYPGAPGRTGYAVGLDVPASVIALIDDLAAAGYARQRRAGRRRATCSTALAAGATTRSSRWRNTKRLLARRAAQRPSRGCAKPGASRRTIPMSATAPSVSARKNSATSWSRCRPIAAARRSAAPIITIRSLPPRHALVAFGLWLQHVAKADALVHMGAHGTLEWLPGKAVALTAECFPGNRHRAVAGDLSVHRQQSGRGGAGQAPHRRA